MKRILSIVLCLFIGLAAYSQQTHPNQGVKNVQQHAEPLLMKQRADSTVRVLPQNGETLKKSVKVVKPGTLARLLPNNEPTITSELKVSGKINAADIRLLRHMAGNQDGTEYSSWNGCLTKLDLSEATLVKDSDIVNRIDARVFGLNFRYRGKIYDFKKITDAEWKELCAQKGNSRSELKIVKNDGIYWACFRIQGNIIGPEMFRGCVNLEQLILPYNCLSISADAFADCSRLKEITMPSALVDFYNCVFTNCTSLEKIIVCSDSPVLAKKENIQSKAASARMNYNPAVQVVVDSSLMTLQRARNLYYPNAVFH